MRLYHGSNVKVDKPVLMPLVRALDFGRAFYTTTDFEQASKWAKTSVLRRGNGVPVVSCFEYDENTVQDIRILKFPSPTIEWLEFISRNRNQGLDDSGYDLVSGPVANDSTMPVLNLFFKGAYTEEEALRRLLPQRLKDKFAFKTEKSLQYLKFVEAMKV